MGWFMITGHLKTFVRLFHSAISITVHVGSHNEEATQQHTVTVMWP